MWKKQDVYFAWSGLPNPAGAVAIRYQPSAKKAVGGMSGSAWAGQAGVVPREYNEPLALVP
jgi:hypothetical protein